MTGPTYDSYLRLPELLDQQRREGPPDAHDELVFIAVHQVCELWFKVLLFELTDARDRMLDGDACTPRQRLDRCLEVERLLTEQMRVLDTMTPRGFAQFRSALGSASGAQSAQFREIEVLSGLNDPRWTQALGWLGPNDRARLRRRLEEPSLWDGYLAVLARVGFDIATRQGRLEAYTRMAHPPEGDDAVRAAGELTEALVDHDQAWSLWRARHAMTVERQIGRKPGTGGSVGGRYLWSRVPERFYPELWEARGMVGGPVPPGAP